MNTQQAVKYLLRRVYLLQLANSIMFVTNLFKNRKSNQLFLAEHPEFIPPPAYLAYDAYNHTNWRVYHDTGLRHGYLISDLLRENVFEKEIKICEWGCGPARVIRHLQKIAGFEKVRRYGTDYNEKTILWCKKNIKDVHFSTNSLAPPLSLESEFFDCVYAISIFTHLSEQMHHAWIEELLRILKPNGILIFTTHGQAAAERVLLPREKARFDSGVFVVRDRIKEGKKQFTAYHPHTFIQSKLLKDCFVVKHICHPIEYELEQEVWVVKKHP